MSRLRLRSSLLALGSLLLAAPALAEEAGPEPEPVRPTIKISLSSEDPNVHSAQRELGDYVEFFLFTDGVDITGCEFGVEIFGADFLAYAIDTDKLWMPVPMPDPYPRTICQVRAGSECFYAPTYVGRILVKPHDPNGTVQLDVVPSDQHEYAVLLDCNQEPVGGLIGQSAVINGEVPAPYVLVGEGDAEILTQYEAAQAKKLQQTLQN